MTQDKLFVVFATACSFGGFLSAAAAWRSGTPGRNRLSLVLLGLAWLCLCWFLRLRGQAISQCPLTNVAEMLIFVSWGLLGFYLGVGSSFRWSLLGMFTAPLVLTLLSVALLSPDPRPEGSDPHEFWNEMHKALSVLSFSAFALACVAGVMFVVQERHLKSRNAIAIFRKLPPLINLHKTLRRLIWIGLGMLTGGIASALLMPDRTVSHALTPVWVVWAGYVAILLHARLAGGSARREAWAAILAFLFPVATLLIIGH